MPRQWPGVTGGMKRRAPVGGEAYGTPRKTSTGARRGEKEEEEVEDDDDEEELRWTISPFREPYLIFTVLGDSVRGKQRSKEGLL